MPGLGWILKRSLYKEELEPKWPTPERVSKNTLRRLTVIMPENFYYKNSKFYTRCAQNILITIDVGLGHVDAIR